MESNYLEHEDFVYSTIVEYLNKNRVLEIDLVLPYISARVSKSSINLNRDGILTIIRSLKKKKIVVEGKSLTRDDVLQNKKRLKIYNYIKQNPGAFYYNLAKNLGMGSYVIIWHVDILEEFNFIKRDVIENHEVFYESSLDFSYVRQCYFLTNPKSKQILELIKQQDDGITKTQLARNLGMHPNTIKKYVNSLEDIGLLLKVNLSNKSLYFFNENKIHPSNISALKLTEIKFIESKEREQLEGEKLIQNSELMCTVHGNPVIGRSYVCPNCKSIYCNECTEKLKEKEIKCFNCRYDLNF